jgi:dipeptidyl aminopeptidase/acylaminoacyl peptidase
VRRRPDTELIALVRKGSHPAAEALFDRYWTHAWRAAFAAQIGTRAEDQDPTEIYVMRADGTDRRRLTTNDVLDVNPSWSPSSSDGTRIAFTRVVGEGTDAAQSGIFVMDADGGGEGQITRSACMAERRRQPCVVAGRIDDRLHTLGT